MKTKSFISHFVLVFMLSFLTVGCLQGDFKPLSNMSDEIGSGDPGGGQCPLKITQATPYLSVYSDRKIHASDFENQFGMKSMSEMILSHGSQIILKIDTNCVDHGNGTNLSHQFKNSLRNYQRFDLRKEDYVIFELPAEMSVSDLEEMVNSDECVLGAAPNSKIELQAMPSDTLYPLQNNMRMIKHDQYYQKIQSQITEEVLVAVVDSGSDQLNPDMEGRHWRNNVELNGQAGVDDDGNGFVDDIYGYSWACYIGGDKPFYAWWMPHGEHVAGVIAANTDNNIGVASLAGQKAKIMNLNVIYSGNPAFPCNGSEQDLVLAIRGIRYAADNGALVVNLSMGTFGRNSMMEDVMRYAVAKGVYVASAAGNNNKLILDDMNNFFYPCAYAKDIDGFSCVGAVDSSVVDTRCGFSNYSTDYVELSAPGCDSSVGDQSYSYGRYGVLSTVRKSDDPMYRYMPGTSMATPHIAGAAALVIGYMKSKTGVAPTPAQVEEILKNGSRKSAALNALFIDGNTLDLEALFKYMDSLIQPGC